MTTSRWEDLPLSGEGVRHWCLALVLLTNQSMISSVLTGMTGQMTTASPIRLINEWEPVKGSNVVLQKL